MPLGDQEGFEERFAARLQAHLEKERPLDCPEAIEAVGESIKALGLSQVVSAYLATTFDAVALSDLSGAELRKAMRFIARLQQQGSPRHTIPLLPGMQAEGRWCLFDGRVSWQQPG